MFLFGVLGAHPIAHRDKKIPTPKWIGAGIDGLFAHDSFPRITMGLNCVSRLSVLIA